MRIKPALTLALFSVMILQSCGIRSNEKYMNHPLSTIVYNQSVETIEREMGDDIDALNLKIAQLEKRTASLSIAGLSNCSCDEINQILDSMSNAELDKKRRECASDYLATVFYSFNSAELNEASVTALNAWYIKLNELDLWDISYKFEILASTDSKGNEAYNSELRRKRANALKDFLILKLEVPNENISVAELMLDNSINDALQRRAMVKILGSD